jgi:CheY-like chemotaxis protein
MTKILLVEDDKSLREIYGVRLLAEGYDIVSAGDGEEALAMAIKDRPSLIVSDVMMPKISGFDMLDILRSTTETKDIKVIMMTALSSEDQRARGQQLGADRYLVKSQVGIEDVVRTVHDVLQDAPTASSTSFSSPAPQPAQPTQSFASPRPAAPTAPAPRPVAEPFAPQSTPAPIPTSNAVSPQVSAPVQSTPQQQSPVAAPLPQPTAPFSTPRPAAPTPASMSMSNRIIEPITQAAPSSAPVADLIQKELDGHQEQPAPQLTVPTPPAPVAPEQQPHGLNFEETPVSQNPYQQQ